MLVGDEPGIPFGRPPLSKTYLRGEEELADWYVKPTEWYAEHDVERKLGSVVALDPSGGEIRLGTTERIAFDQLLIATGGRNRRLQVRGADLDGVFSLRTVAECEAIKDAARPGQRAVVVGMGFIGSEVTASLRQLGVSVTAVCAGSGPLASVLGPEVAAVMADAHRDQGVQLLVDDRAEAFTGDGHVQGVLTANGARLTCDFAVVGAGIEPAVDLFEGTGIAIENGIVVDSRCRTSAANVFAAGDVANHEHPVFGRIRVEHYNNAERQGRAAAQSMLGAEDAYDDIHTFWSDQYEHKIEYVGYARRWDRFVVRAASKSGRFSASIWRAAVSARCSDSTVAAIPSWTWTASLPQPSGWCVLQHVSMPASSRTRARRSRSSPPRRRGQPLVIDGRTTLTRMLDPATVMITVPTSAVNSVEDRYRFMSARAPST